MRYAVVIEDSETGFGAYVPDLPGCVAAGETRDEVLSTLEDMRAVGIDIVTIGQYLRPTARHRPIHRYVHPSEFDEYKAHGEALGIPHVESGPLVRSSYHAKESRAAVPVTIGAGPA